MLPARHLPGCPSPSAVVMPSRQQAPAVNARTAMRVAGAEFELKDLARTIDVYSATFQMGMVTHVESGIDEAVVEDEPPTPALYALIRKVQGVFASMTSPAPLRR